jgi:hypothetical protein
LYREGPQGEVLTNPSGPETVLDYYCAGHASNEAADRGFWITLSDIAKRSALRLDPKYSWLWVKQDGVAFGDLANTEPLSAHLEIVELKKVKKGDLELETALLDLENVASKTGVAGAMERVDEIGSDKVSFDGAELLFSKLEPYLGKVVIQPPQDAIGSTEWIGLRRTSAIPLLYVAHLLMHSKLCEAYRRLQSGKRHARLSPEEMLELKVQTKQGSDLAEAEKSIEKNREAIAEIQQKVAGIRIRMERAIYDPNGIIETKDTPTKARRLG